MCWEAFAFLHSCVVFLEYENPLTLQKELQYPVELGTSIGGRIVGELNVDYLLPTYQKNDFDRSDTSWAQTVEAICGVGPFSAYLFARSLGANKHFVPLSTRRYALTSKHNGEIFSSVNPIAYKYRPQFWVGPL